MSVRKTAISSIENGKYSSEMECQFQGRTLTAKDMETLLSIKDSVACGHDVEVRGTPDGSLRVLEITRKNISAR